MGAITLDFEGVVALGPEDAEAIVELHRRVFTSRDGKARVLPPLIDTIYASDGAVRWIREIASARGSTDASASHCLLGVRRARRLVAYIHFRPLNGAWHLNHLAVLEEERGRGHARALKAAGVDLGRRLGFTRRTTDVSTKNRIILDWNLRLGFQIEKQTDVFYVRLPDNPCSCEAGVLARKSDESSPHVALSLGGEEFVILDWWASLTRHAMFGFSEFDVVSRTGSARVGRLSDRRFRLFGAVPEHLCTLMSLISPDAVLVNLRDHGELAGLDKPEYSVVRMSRMI
jgi:GNAT superfamily N-acetyltransferase